jgi:hypothetical protein
VAALWPGNAFAALCAAVADEFIYAANCHCSNCRRTTGSAFKPFAGIERHKLVVTRGLDKLMVFGDEIGNNTHCKICGSLVHSVVRNGEFVHIAMGTLDDDPTIRPTAHIFVGSKARWFTITDDLPQYEEHVVVAAADWTAPPCRSACVRLTALHPWRRLNHGNGRGGLELECVTVRTRYVACNPSFKNHALLLVVVDDHTGGGWAGLAAEDEADLELPWFQRIVQFHFDAAFQEFGAAGRAHAALAGERQIEAGAQRGVEDDFTFGNRNFGAGSIDDDRGDRLGLGVRAERARRLRAAAEGGIEPLDVDLGSGEADAGEGGLGGLDHAKGAADISVIDRGAAEDAGEQGVHFLAVEAAVEDVDVLTLAGEDVGDGEAGDVAVLQILECVAEHDLGGCAAAVEQEEAALRFAGEHGFHHRQDGRDARAGGDREVQAGAGWVPGDAEAARGAHDFDGQTGFQRIVRPDGKYAAFLAFNGDAKLAVLLAGADGIGAAEFGSVQRGAESEILARAEVVERLQIWGDIESKRDGVRGFTAEVGHAEPVEARGG